MTSTHGLGYQTLIDVSNFSESGTKCRLELKLGDELIDVLPFQLAPGETVEASKSAINELPFVPMLVRTTQVLAGLDLEAVPFLLGYVMTRPKPTSEFILASESGDPVLVWWRYGLGMTVAFTSDAKSQWAAEWLTWPEFGRFWAQVIRHAMRKSEAKGVFVEVLRRGENARVVVDSVNPAGAYINLADTRMTLICPNLEKQVLPLAQSAPGRYEAEFRTTDSGAYHLELSQSQNEVSTFRQTRGLVVGYPEELRLGKPDEPLTRRVAQVSGGIYAPTMELIFDPGDRTAREVLRLQSYLLSAALLLLVLDVAMKRVEFRGLFGA